MGVTSFILLGFIGLNAALGLFSLTIGRRPKSTAEPRLEEALR